jgi:hypothetical protein
MSGAFILGAILAVRYTPVRGFPTADTLGRFLDRAGIWAPVAFIAVHAVGVCIFIPGTLLTGIGAAIFGPYGEFLYVWTGAMIGSTGAFFIGTLKEVWATGEWVQLLSFKVFLSIGLFVFSFFILKIIKSARREST